MKTSVPQSRWAIRRIRDGVFYRFKKLTFRPTIIDREIAGERIRFLLGDLFGEAAYGLEHTEWPELNWIKEHCIKPGDVVIDCGANHGFSTVLFAKWVGPAGRVYAFEPSSHNMALLKENLRLNGITNVICHQVAVGAASGTVSISSHPNASVVLDARADHSLEKVSLVRLDDVLEGETPNFLSCAAMYSPAFNSFSVALPRPWSASPAPPWPAWRPWRSRRPCAAAASRPAGHRRPRAALP